MTSSNEQRLVTLVDKYTQGMRGYDRGITATFALAAYRAGYRAAEADRTRPPAPGESLQNASG